jgi:hypothetical protein
MAVGWGVVLAMSAGMAAAADRLYDRDVEKIIDRANGDLGKFLGNMKSDAKGAKVTRGATEYDVSDYLSDLKEEGARLEERFSGDGKATPNATAFLQKAKGFDGFVDRHPGFTGADKQWQALRPTLQSLADAYQIDWSGDPTSWQATRYSDAEVAGWAKQLDADIKSYSSALTQAAKEAKVDKTARAALDEQVKALAGGAKGLQKALSARTPAGNALSSLEQSVKSVGDQASSLGLASAASSAAAPLEATLGKLSTALGS